MNAGYRAYLKSDHWQQRRRQAHRENHSHCSVCRRNDVPLDVHHLTYKHIGDERHEELNLVCRKCHDAIHEYQRRNPHLSIKRATKRYRRKLYGYA